jgi:hypothetical protein
MKLLPNQETWVFATPQYLAFRKEIMAQPKTANWLRQIHSPETTRPGSADPPDKRLQSWEKELLRQSRQTRELMDTLLQETKSPV